MTMNAAKRPEPAGQAGVVAGQGNPCLDMARHMDALQDTAQPIALAHEVTKQ